MADETILRVEIAGAWSAQDFTRFFAELQFLYEVAQFSQIDLDGQRSRPLFWLRRGRVALDYLYRDPEYGLIAESQLIRRALSDEIIGLTGEEPEVLAVKQIRYASPGLSDLAGIGKAMAELRKFVFGITDRFIAKEDRRLDRDEKRQDILAKKIKNAENLLKLSKKAGLDSDGARRLMREVLEADYFLESKVIDGQITSISSPQDEGDAREE
jgi:hypothetical protein